MKTILFIDGRNFIGKINSILNPEKDKNKEVNFFIYNFAGNEMKAAWFAQRLFHFAALSIQNRTKIKGFGAIFSLPGLKDVATFLKSRGSI